MKKILVICLGTISLNVLAQPIPVSSLGNVSYSLNENGTPIPSDNINQNNAKVPFIANTSSVEAPPQPLPGFQANPPTSPLENQTSSPLKIPSDISELIKGKKNGETINETNNTGGMSNSKGVTGVTLQTEPIVFSTTRGYIEDWNKTSIEEHTRKGEENTQRRYQEFLNKK